MKLIMENWKRYLNEQSPAGFYGDLPKKDQERIGKAQQAMLDTRKAKLSDADAETIRTMVSLFDPTAISAYPDIPPAIEAFEKYRNIFAAANLAIALAAAIPILGKAGSAIKVMLNLRKVNNSLKQVKGSEKIVGKINSTLKELPSPEEVAKMRRITNHERALRDWWHRKNMTSDLTDFDLKQRTKFKDMDLQSDYALGDLIPSNLVFIRSDWKPGMKPNAFEHEWLTPKKINQSISPRLQKKFEDAQVHIRKQVADRSKTVNQRAATQNIKKPGHSINSPTLRNPRTEPLTVQGGPRTISSPPPIPKKKK